MPSLMSLGMLATALIAPAAAYSVTELSSTLAMLFNNGVERRVEAGHQGPLTPTEKFTSFLMEAKQHLTSLQHSWLFEEKAGTRQKRAKTVQSSIYDVSHSYFPDNGDGFYAVLPEYITAAVPGTSTSWSSSCFESNTALTTGSGLNFKLNITSGALNASAPTGCVDLYFVATVEFLSIVEVSAAGSIITPFNATTSAGSTWVGREGIRIFRFLHDPLTTISDALATISLFIPSLTEATLDPASQALNAKFLQDYVNITMLPRAVDLIDMDWSYVQSGDLMVISRLDGLGTMEQWGTGASSSHIVMAVRVGEAQDLYIAESTAKDA
jgi:hypothetical protein